MTRLNTDERRNAFGFVAAFVCYMVGAFQHSAYWALSAIFWMLVAIEAQQ